MAVDDYAASTSTTGRVTAGGSVTGTLEAAGDLDWFSVSLVAGKQYTFALEPGATNDLADPYLKLFSSDGKTLIDENDDANGLSSEINASISASGTYYLEASSGTNGGGTGSYVLSVSAPITDDFSGSNATTGRVVPGGSTTGRLEISGDNDWFAVSLVAGQRYTFALDAASTNGLPDPLLSLYSSDGTLITSNDDTNGLNSELTYLATATGTFYLGASSGPSDEGTGSYTLSSSLPIADDYLATVKTNGLVIQGGTTNGQLEYVGDNDWFAINLVAGQQYTFNLNSGTTNGLEDPSLSLYNSSGGLITSNDDSNGLNSEITYTATSTGTYYLGAGSSSHGTGTGKGTYTISSSYPSANGATVVTGTVGNDTVDGGVGNNLIDGGAGADTVSYSGNRSTFSIVHQSDGTYSVVDNAGAAGNDTLSNVEQVKFSDVTVNLTVQAKAASISTDSLNSLTELYVAYFNRVPDADGLSYWIDQLKGGQSLEQIGSSFYAAAIQYSALTGYSGTMTNADFVTLIYKNVLGRSGSTAPPAEDVNYWANNLATGHDTRGTLIKTMLGAAHSYKGDTTWGWVADLLDNKVSVGKTFAVDDGITYNTPADSITHGMDIAAAVTSASTDHAIQLIGVADAPL